jgi:ribosome modulation factor
MKEAIRDRLTDGDAKDGVRAGRGLVRGGCARGTNAPCLVNELEQTRRIVHAHLPKCHQGHSSEIAPAEVSSRALKRDRTCRSVIKGTQAEIAPAEVSSRALKRDRTCRSVIKGTQAEIAPAEVSSRALKRRSHLPKCHQGHSSGDRTSLSPTTWMVPSPSSRTSQREQPPSRSSTKPR